MTPSFPRSGVSGHAGAVHLSKYRKPGHALEPGVSPATSTGAGTPPARAGEPTTWGYPRTRRTPGTGHLIYRHQFTVDTIGSTAVFFQPRVQNLGALATCAPINSLPRKRDSAFVAHEYLDCHAFRGISVRQSSDRTTSAHCCMLLRQAANETPHPVQSKAAGFRPGTSCLAHPSPWWINVFRACSAMGVGSGRKVSR
jgi:hypothetical protein